MKKIIAILAISLLLFTPVAGFSNQIKTIDINNDEFPDIEREEFQRYYDSNLTIYGPDPNYKIIPKESTIYELIEPKTIETPIISSNCIMESPWPMYCHDPRHTGRSPYSTIDNIGVEKWRFDAEDEVASSPVIDKQGVIYIIADYLFAIYPNGTEKWRFYYDGRVVTAPAIDENGNIYFGTIWRDYFYALDYNGTLKWRYPLGWTWASPTIGDDGIIYAPATDNWNVVAFYQNGTTKWGFHANEKIYSSPAIGPDNTIYFGSWDQHLYALHQNNGTLKWKYNTGGGIGTSPCIDDNGIIYIVSATNGYLNAVYPNGTLKWRRYTNGGTSPTVGPDGTIYCGWTNLYAINPEDGSIKWTFDPGEDRRIEEGTPCTSAEGTIYFGTHIGEYYGGEIIAVNPDGTEKWRVMIATDWVMSAPAIGSDGTVYAGSWDEGPPYGWGFLHAIDKLDPNAPTAPIIDGPKFGLPEIEYTYSFKSTSPLGKDVYYYIDWGDIDWSSNQCIDWVGPYPSGEEVKLSHKWRHFGSYTIKARAKDTDNLWGPWGEFKRNKLTNFNQDNKLFLNLNQQTSQSSFNFQSKSSVLFQFFQKLMNI